LSKIKLIAELGINHNGSLNVARGLIDVAKVSQFNFVKLQKRNPDKAVPENQKNKEKKVPWREDPITYLQYKKDIEFSPNEVNDLAIYSKKKNMELFCSVWDEDSAQEMKRMGMRIVKIPSAKLTNHDLLKLCDELYDFKILSTGMSYEDEIQKAIHILKPDVIMHTNSVYPTSADQLKLRYIEWLVDNHNGFRAEIGYSSHYYGIKDIFFAIGLGATWIEKHITLSHKMWGSDQKASVEPNGVYEIGRAIRDMEDSLDGYEPRKLYSGEEKKRESLRG
jgi:N-acetylneuraminate synthase